MIRDGHRRVPEESHRYIYPVMPGSLALTESQIKTLETDVDSAFEITIDMLDQMDQLLNLQSKGVSFILIVYDTMECLRWSSLVPQGQCLLAPLILVILDTSKYYDYLVKMIFKLHGQIPSDALEGHRGRFREVFRRTKKFYEESKYTLLDLGAEEQTASQQFSPVIQPDARYNGEIYFLQNIKLTIISYVGELVVRDALRVESDDACVREANERAKASEERYLKLKAVYEKFRQEHVGALIKLGDLQKKLELSDNIKMDKEEEVRIFLQAFIDFIIVIYTSF
uniref:ANTH domain-containing protein n=1 Tax=Heterorhabditis bacteriophora TaxID=37862 RepID=A0A1I7WZE4_HETBA